jgi:hypothetical protein
MSHSYKIIFSSKTGDAENAILSIGHALVDQAAMAREIDIDVLVTESIITAGYRFNMRPGFPVGPSRVIVFEGVTNMDKGLLRRALSILSSCSREKQEIWIDGTVIKL